MKFPVYKSEAEAKRGIYVEDREIVALYLARSETAIVETDKKYGRYCHYIAYRILENEEDAEWLSYEYSEGGSSIITDAAGNGKTGAFLFSDGMGGIEFVLVVTLEIAEE